MIIDKLKDLGNKLLKKDVPQASNSDIKASGDNRSIDEDAAEDFVKVEDQTKIVIPKSKKLNFDVVSDKNKDAVDWFGDRYQTLAVQRNIAIFLLIISIVCVTCTGISLAVIAKSKTIEPFVIEIEKSQGLVRYIDNAKQMHNYTQDELVRDSYIKQYIEARETFDSRNYDYFYHKVVKYMSSDGVYNQFKYLLRSNGKENPTKLLAGSEMSRVIITSISQLKPQVLQVRFVIEGKFGDGNSVRVNKVAILEYAYFNLSTDEDKRYINPLNFTITGYRSSDENV